jgi:hypothetical protein
MSAAAADTGVAGVLHLLERVAVQIRVPLAIKVGLDRP